MQLVEIFDIIHDNDPGVWHEVNLDRAEESEHHSRIVFVPDVSISISWGMKPMHANDWNPDWVDFPDPVWRPFFADIECNGVTVDRLAFYSIDGGRSVLPSPSEEHDERVSPTELGPVTARTVTQVAYDVGALIANHKGWEGGREYEQYFKRAGLEVRGRR